MYFKIREILSDMNIKFEFPKQEIKCDINTYSNIKNGDNIKPQQRKSFPV